MKSKLDFIEALRGYAILGVLLTHSSHSITNLPIWLDNLGVQGARGVQLFFILSSFILFYSLDKKYLDGKVEISDFFLKRFFRIAPAFYAALICYTLLDYIVNYFGLSDFEENFTLADFLSTITFTSVLHPNWLYSMVPGGWSISSEFMFYLLIPLLFRLIRNLKTAIIFLGIFIVASQLANQVFLSLTSITDDKLRDSYVFHWFPSQFPVFLFGILFYYLIKTKFDDDNETVVHKRDNIILMFSLIFLIFLSVINKADTFNVVGQYGFALAFVGVAYGLSAGCKALIVNKYILFIGKISFSMYLVHFFVLDILLKLVLPRVEEAFSPTISLIIMYTLTFLLSIPLSYLSYRYIEKTGMEFGRKVTKHLEMKLDNPSYEQK